MATARWRCIWELKAIAWNWHFVLVCNIRQVRVNTTCSVCCPWPSIWSPRRCCCVRTRAFVLSSSCALLGNMARPLVARLTCSSNGIQNEVCSSSTLDQVFSDGILLESLTAEVLAQKILSYNGNVDILIGAGASDPIFPCYRGTSGGGYVDPLRKFSILALTF